MNVLSIQGSPRKSGTSNRIAQRFVEAARDHGADVSQHHLNSMQYRGCQACEGCHAPGATACILKDDLTEVLDGMHAADVIVFATPVYYGDVTGQFKCFMDRTYSHINPEYFYTDPSKLSRLPENKKILLVVTQGAPENDHDDLIQRYENFFNLLQLEYRIVRGYELNAPDADINSQRAEIETIVREWFGK